MRGEIFRQGRSLSPRIAKSFWRPLFPIRCRKQSRTAETSGETAPKTRLSKNTNNLLPLPSSIEGYFRPSCLQRHKKVTTAHRGVGEGGADQSLQGMPKIRSGLGFCPPSFSLPFRSRSSTLVHSRAIAACFAPFAMARISGVFVCLSAASSLALRCSVWRDGAICPPHLLKTLARSASQPQRCRAQCTHGSE